MIFSSGLAPLGGDTRARRTSHRPARAWGSAAYDWRVLPRTAVIVDQWALLRVGIGTILRQMSIRVVADEPRGRDGIARARAGEVDLLVLGNHLDVAHADTVRDAKALPHAPLVLALLSQPDVDELASLLAAGADSVLVRSADGDEVADAVRRMAAGERVLSPALSPLLPAALRAASQAPTPPAGKLDGALLTAKEREVLAALAHGRATKEIASELFVSVATVKTHLAHIYTKLGVTDRSGAVARAVELGLLG